MTRILVDRFPFTIGRGPDNDLVLPDASVSRDHAFLRFSSSGLSIVDNESRNGVYVNQERIQDYRRLKPGDQLQLGAVRVEFMSFGGGEGVTIGQQRSPVQVQYLPARETWDPMERLMPSGAAEAPAERTGGRVEGLQWIVKLFLEAPLSEIYEHILNLVEETLPYDRCFLILFEEGDPEKMDFVARRVNTSRPDDVIVSRDILRRVAQSGESVVVSGIDASYSPSESFVRSGATTAICVPLIVRRKVTGVIYLDRLVSGHPLSPRDIERIGPLAGFVGLKLENVRLLQSHVENQVLVRDLEVAKTIQEGLLPCEPVRLPGYSTEGYTSSCHQVGGDYFDFLLRDESHLTVVLGDVSGKGLSSALYMAGIRSALHAHHEDGLDIARLMARLEKHASRAFRPEYFLTLVLGELDTVNGRFTYCNAGHLPPVVVSAGGEARELRGTDPALNIADCETFHCHHVDLDPGDVLFLYTDGLVEAANPEEVFFGFDNLLNVLVKNRVEPLPTLRKRLLGAIEEYTQEDNSSDDRTLILVRREYDDDFDELDLGTEDLTLLL